MADPVRFYVSYLSTPTLVRCLEDVENKLVPERKRELSTDHRRLLNNVRRDLVAELARRQIHLAID
jgi:hypothetical protein